MRSKLIFNHYIFLKVYEKDFHHLKAAFQLVSAKEIRKSPAVRNQYWTLPGAPVLRVSVTENWRRVIWNNFTGKGKLGYNSFPAYLSYISLRNLTYLAYLVVKPWWSLFKVGYFNLLILQKLELQL